MKTKNSGLYYAVKKNMRSACMLAIAVLLMASTLLMTGCSCSGKSSPVGATIVTVDIIVFAIASLIRK